MSVRSMVDRRTLMKGAAGAGVVALVAGRPGGPAGASSVVLDASPGCGVANRVALQSAINATPPGESLHLPAGSYEIDVTAASITLPAPISIVGADGGATTLDVLPKATTTMRSLFVVSTSLTSGDFTFQNLTIEGPTSTTGGGSAIEWVRLGATGSISCFLLNVTGQFQYAVRRSGIGLVNIVASALNARGSVVSVTDGSATPASSRCVVAGTHLSGFGATTGSIGIDLHSHISLQCVATTFEHLSYTAICAQGGAAVAAPSWTVSDSTVIDAALATTGPHSHATFVRVRQTVSPSWPAVEQQLRGPTTMIGCDLRGAGTLADVSGGRPVRFVGCWFEPRGIGVGLGPTSGDCTFDDCTWKLSGNGRALNLATGFGATVRLRRSLIADCTSVPFTVNAKNGTLSWSATTVDSPRSSYGLIIDPAVTVLGSPTLLHSGTCPSAPA